MNAEWRSKNDLPRSAAFSTAGGGNEVVLMMITFHRETLVLIKQYLPTGCDALIINE